MNWDGWERRETHESKESKMDCAKISCFALEICVSGSRSFEPAGGEGEKGGMLRGVAVPEDYGL